MTSTASYQIRLSSKRLNEKQSQVKFSAHNKNHETKGHMLLTGNLSLREVVEIITEKVHKIQQHACLSPQDLCCLTSQNKPAGYIFFEA